MKIPVEYWQGFWWWFDAARGDWFIGPSPHISVPEWAPVGSRPELRVAKK